MCSAAGEVSGGFLLGCGFPGVTGTGVPSTSSSLIGHSWRAAGFHNNSKATKKASRVISASTYPAVN